jgi:hypothetical protein
LHGTPRLETEDAASELQAAMSAGMQWYDVIILAFLIILLIAFAAWVFSIEDDQ